MIKKLGITTSLLAAIALSAGACSSSNTKHQATAAQPAQPAASSEGEATQPAQSIVDIAASAGSFNTLVTALKSAELVEALQGNGPFTVFAPTDAAFAKLPAGTVEALLKDKEALKKVLTYHVVAGKVMASDVVNITSAKTLQGQNIAVDASQGVMINNASVVKADIVASNGVIHVIDTVLIPQ